jgi:uncharacterized protein
MTAPAIMCDGTRIDILNPRPEDFAPTQIATQLGRIPRFLGATCRHYSVLEHSILGCEFVRQHRIFGELSRSIARSFLLHDAHEAVIGDFTEPLADVVPGFRELMAPIKAKIDYAIELAFGVDLSSDGAVRAVKQIDQVMLQQEWTDLMPTTWYGPDYLADRALLPTPIDKYNPHANQQQMVAQFCHLIRVTG